jgi:hypothetical protein
MTTGLTTVQSFERGRTLRWKTTFVDFDGNVTQPASANLLIYASTTTQDGVLTTIPMTQQTPTDPLTAWIGIWDTRGFAPGNVQFSIETPAAAPVPVAVEDGSILLTANQANQPTF